MQEIIEKLESLTSVVQSLLENSRINIPLEIALWGVPEIAEYSKRSKSTIYKYTEEDDFPKPLTLPSTGKSENTRNQLYRAQEVIEWFLKDRSLEKARERVKKQRGRRRSLDTY